MPNVNTVPLLLSEDNLFLFLYMRSHSCSVIAFVCVCVCVCVRARARCSGNDGTQGHLTVPRKSVKTATQEWYVA